MLQDIQGSCLLGIAFKRCQRFMSENVHRRRPLSVTILVWLVLIVTMINLVRMVNALVRYQTLAELLPMNPIYIVLSGLVWVVIGLPLVVGLWRGNSWAPRLALLAGLAYSLYFWTDRLLIPSYPGRNSNWPFVLVLNLSILALGYLALTRAKVREYFGEIYEKQS